MKKLLSPSVGIILMMTCFINLSFGQTRGTWIYKQQTPAVYLDGLCMLSGGVTGFAAGSQSSQSAMISQIFKTTNSGQNWEALAFPYASSCQINDVYFVSNVIGWVVGRNGKIYKTTDGGSNWLSQTTGTTDPFSTVFFLNQNEGWIGGANSSTGIPYVIFHTTNGGSNWQNQSPGMGCSINDVFFIDNLNGWFGGADNSINPQINHTTNGGATWVRQSTPFDATNGQVTAVKFANANEGWASISSLYTTPSGPVLHTTNGGANWGYTFSTNMFYNTLAIKDYNSVAVVSYDVFTGIEKVFQTTNGGTNWSFTQPPFACYTNGIQYTGNSIWISAVNTQIATTTNNGSNWSSVLSSPSLTDIAWVNSSTAWAVGGYNSINNTAYKSTDGGNTWIPATNAPGGNQVQFVDNNNGFMLWDGNSAALKRTTNGGTNWNSFAIPSGGAWIGGIFFVNANNGWAYGSTGKIVYTTNAGVSWTTQTSGTTNYVESIYFVSATEGWAGGGYGGGSGFILHTTNAGTNWSQQTLPGTNMVMNLFFLNNQNGWAAAASGAAFYTTNGGNNWAYLTTISVTFIDKIVFKNLTTGWLICHNQGSDGRSWIYKSTDGGNNWATEWSSLLPQNQMSDFAIIGDSVLVCGNNNTIMKYSDPPVGLMEKIMGSDEILISAFPNPFSENITLKIVLSEDSFVKMEIYNLQGQKQAILTTAYFPKGINEFTWNGNDENGVSVPRGSYIVKLQTKNSLSTYKIIKL